MKIKPWELSVPWLIFPYKEYGGAICRIFLSSPGFRNPASAHWKGCTGCPDERSPADNACPVSSFPLRRLPSSCPEDDARGKEEPQLPYPYAPTKAAVLLKIPDHCQGCTGHPRDLHKKTSCRNSLLLSPCNDRKTSILLFLYAGFRNSFPSS